jgi:hypothetical protein
MAQERTLDWYKDAVKAGQRFQIKFAKSNMWPEYKRYYRHEFPDGILPVNLVFSILRSSVPQIYFRNPQVTLSATKPGLEYELHARLAEDIANWLLRELATKYEMKKMIPDSFLCGLATGFVGYDSEYGYSKKHSIENVASLTQFNKKGYRIEYNSNVNPGMPWFLRSRPEDTVYPWGTECKENAEWVATRHFRPLLDLKADPKYKNTSKLHGSFNKVRTTPAGGTREPENQEQPGDHEWVELWQLRDAKTKEIVCFTMDCDDFLRKEEDLMQFEGLPCETIAFNPDPDFIYGIPDVRIIEPQLLELNEIRTQAMKHRRIDIVKMLIKKGALKPEQIKNLFSEDVQAAVEIEVDNAITESVMPLTPGASGILADLQNMGEVIRGDVREMVGFSRSSTGEYQGKTHISAKETDIVNWANQIRIDERRDMMSDLLTNVVRKFLQIIFTHWNTSMVRSVVGPDGAKWWLQFTGPEIKAEYNIKVDPTNAVPVDQRTKRQDAVELAGAYAQMNAGAIAQGQPIPQEIQRYFYSQFDGINLDRLIAQTMQQPPMQPQGQPGMNPGQPVPPGAAAQIMTQNKQAR